MKFLILILSLLLPSALSAQTITVFTNRAAFEAAMGSFKVVDDFSLGGTYLGVTTNNGAINGAGKWADIARDPEPSTVWATPFGSTAFGGTWDTTPSGVGGGLAFELDFGGGNIVTVPANVPGNSPANVFFGFTAGQPFFNIRERQINSAGNTLQETHTLDDLTVQVPADFADAFFTQAGTGAWDTAAHWNPAAVPGANQRAFILPTGGTVVSGPTTVATVRQLFLGNGTTASRLNLDPAGTLTASGGGIVRAGSTLGGAGRFFGPLNMAAGSTLTVADGQTLQAGAATAGGFATTGTITVGTGTLILEDTGATPLGTLTTVAGGTLTALGGTAQIGSGDTLRGHGLLTGAFELLSGGTLRAQNGSLQVEQLTAVAGTATVDDGRMLSIGGTNAFGFSTVSVGAGGTLSTSGRLQLLGSSTLGAGATISGTSGLDLGGALNHAGAQVFNAGTGDLTIFNISFTPDTTDTLGGTRLVMSGNSAAFIFTDEATLGTPGNQIVLDGGGSLLPLSTITLPASRAVEITATGGELLAPVGVDFTVNGAISGAGIATIAGGSGGALGGTLRLMGAVTNTGGIAVEGATLEAGSASLGGPAGVFNLGRTSGFNTFPAVLRALGNISVAATRSTTFASTTVDTNGFDVTFNQPITGLNLTKESAGVLRLNTKNANDSTHTVIINAGTLRIGINDALGLGANVNTTAGAVFDLNGFNHELLNVNGDGDIALGAGTLTARGFGSTIGGVISGTGGLVMKFGGGRLLGENTFTGGLTVRDGAGVFVKSTAGFGGAGNSVLLDNGGIGSDGEATAPVVIGAAFPLTIAAGGARFGANGQPFIIETQLNGANLLSVQGGGDGYEVRFANPANTFTSNLTIGSNDFGSGVLGIVADGSLGNAANVITLGYRFFDGESNRTGSGTLRAFADIILPASRTLRLNGDENESNGGIFDTNGFNMTVAGPISEVATATPLRKTGAGTLTLNGANTYTGTTDVAAGTLVVNGSYAGVTQVQSGGKLSGNGTVGTVSVFFGGTLAPSSSPGTLHAGDVTFENGSTFALEFASPALGDQLAVTGSVTINGAEIAPIPGYTITGPDIFTVIANDGSDPVIVSDFFTSGGTPLTEGASFVSGGATWQISYTGGDGNDVTLTATPATTQDLTLVSASISDPPGGGGGKRIQGSIAGPPGATVRLQRSSDLLDWSVLSTLSLDSLGTASFDVTDALAGERAFYRLISP